MHGHLSFACILSKNKRLSRDLSPLELLLQNESPVHEADSQEEHQAAGLEGPEVVVKEADHQQGAQKGVLGRDHQEELDRDIERRLEFVDQVQQAMDPSPLVARLKAKGLI